jgi:hypothetical protein
MQVPVLVAARERAHRVDASEPIRCVLVARPRHQNELVRYVLVVTAWLAIVLLIAIAFHYSVAAR